MEKNTHIHELKDRSRVDIDQEYELHYWTEKFGVTQQELKTAVNSVGMNVHEVETYLSRISRRSSW